MKQPTELEPSNPLQSHASTTHAPANSSLNSSTPSHHHDAHTPHVGQSLAQDLLALDADSYAAQTKGKTGFARVIKATGYSIDGFLAAYRNEAAFRQVLWLNAVLVVILILAPFAMSIKMALLTASILSLIVELFNTGLEAAIDHTSTARHPLAKIAKDVGSAAQFLALLLLFCLWMMAGAITFFGH